MATDPRMARALRSLDGLSTGDAFGEQFFSIGLNPQSLLMHHSTRTPPAGPWRWTDDTAMAAGLVEVLGRHGRVDQDDLADTFARRYAWDNRRGYGATAHGILMAIGAGGHWSRVAPAAFGGDGSMGNGSAMRVAPLGAWFADDTTELVRQARLSAEVTHAHPEGPAGAIAVALAAAFVANHAGPADAGFARALFDSVLSHVPDGITRALVAQARDLPVTYAVDTAASVLGTGSRVTVPDTVPFCLWCAARSAGRFEEAMWETVSAGGDMDTNCAIVGGILAAGEAGAPPPEWVARREPLPEPLE